MALQPLVLAAGTAPRLIRLPLTRQATNYTCGVAICQSLFYYYGDEFRQDVLSDKLKADPDNGTKYQNMVEFAKELGYHTQVLTDMTLDDLRSNVDKGIPVTVCLQAWRDDANAPWKDMWDSGHWAVVIGYDADRLYFMDPSTLGNYTFIPNAEFEDRWHDVEGDGTKLHHFGLIITKDTVLYADHHIMPMN